MPRLPLIAIPLLALAACGGPANNVTETNTGNVVLNDMQANYAFTNDNEQAVNAAAPDDMPAGHVTTANGSMGNTQ